MYVDSFMYKKDSCCPYFQSSYQSKLFGVYTKSHKIIKRFNSQRTSQLKKV